MCRAMLSLSPTRGRFGLAMHYCEIRDIPRTDQRQATDTRCCRRAGSAVVGDFVVLDCKRAATASRRKAA